MESLAIHSKGSVNNILTVEKNSDKGIVIGMIVNDRTEFKTSFLDNHNVGKLIEFLQNYKQELL